MRDTLKNLLYAGNYQELLKISFDSPQFRVSAENASPVISALSVVGRIKEAEQLFLIQRQQLTTKDLVEARFFLGISLFRQQQNTQNKALLLENSRETSHDPIVRFYKYQGLAFIRYFLGQMNSCQLLVEKSLGASIEGDFFFGRILAMDMYGHVLVSLGQITKGISRLDQASEMAMELGQSGLSFSLRVSSVVYEAQYGISGLRGQLEIQKLIDHPDSQDSYSQGYLLLELARQYTRNGEFSKAEETLESASRFIYKSSHKKQQMLLNHRLAELEFQRGQAQKSLAFLTSMKSQHLDLLSESELQQQVLGLELKVIQSLDFPEDAVESVRSKLNQYSKFFRGDLSRRYLKKDGDSPSTQLEDRIGEFKKTLSGKKSTDAATVQKAEELGCVGMLMEASGFQRGKDYLVINYIPEKAFFVSKQGLSLISLGRSENSLRILKVLSKGWTTKDQLVEIVWGYTYSPLRHDPMLYSALQSLRRLMGPYSDWLQRSEWGYRIDPDVDVLDYTRKIKTPEKQENPDEDWSAGLSLKLNYRQLQFLQSFQEHPQGIGVQDYKEQFQVSTITASRDLGDLFKKQLLARTGKGRATRYYLPDQMQALGEANSLHNTDLT